MKCLSVNIISSLREEPASIHLIKEYIQEQEVKNVSHQSLFDDAVIDYWENSDVSEFYNLIKGHYQFISFSGEESNDLIYNEVSSLLNFTLGVPKSNDSSSQSFELNRIALIDLIISNIDTVRSNTGSSSTTAFGSYKIQDENVLFLRVYNSTFINDLFSENRVSILNVFFEIGSNAEKRSADNKFSEMKEIQLLITDKKKTKSDLVKQLNKGEITMEQYKTERNRLEEEIQLLQEQFDLLKV